MTRTIDARTTSAVRSNNGSTPANDNGSERIDTVVIGGGQAGLATGYHLAQHHQEFVILDANQRIGESWRQRWDSLRLLAPARFSSLPGMPFPAPPYSFPTKDEMANYLQSYAEKMKLPVRTGISVHRVTRDGDEFLIETDQQGFRASQVVIATGAYQNPKIPTFASELDPKIRQIHSSEYRNPAQLQEGAVLVVGASNSGAEIAHEVAREHRTWLSGRYTGKLPFDTHSRVAHLLIPVMWFMFNHVLTVRTPLGRKVRPRVLSHGMPLEVVGPEELAAAGVDWVHDRTVGARDGLPLLADGRVLDVVNVVWCTGFRPDFSWIKAQVLDTDGWPRQQRGVVPDVPGLYFVGLPFLYAAASHLIGGVGRDAKYIAQHISVRALARTAR